MFQPMNPFDNLIDQIFSDLPITALILASEVIE
jgi:hypothetical protein